MSDVPPRETPEPPPRLTPAQREALIREIRLRYQGFPPNKDDGKPIVLTGLMTTVVRLIGPPREMDFLP